MSSVPGYDSLSNVLGAAYHQAARGKGKERDEARAQEAGMREVLDKLIESVELGTLITEPGASSSPAPIHSQTTNNGVNSMTQSHHGGLAFTQRRRSA